jgi:hypothetical protein
MVENKCVLRERSRAVDTGVTVASKDYQTTLRVVVIVSLILLIRFDESFLILTLNEFTTIRHIAR